MKNKFAEHEKMQTDPTKKDFEDIENIFKKTNLWNDYTTIEIKILGGKLDIIQAKRSVKRPSN